MSTSRFFVLTALLALAAAGVVEPARAEAPEQSFVFSQTGFADEARITGAFAGADLDGDGWLYGYELTRFELHWSGNRAVAAFSLGFDDRAGLEFELATGRVWHMAGVSTDAEGGRHFSYDSMGWPSYQVPGTVSDEPLGLSSSSWAPLAVSAAVPEPQSLALWLAGLGVVALRRRGRPRH